MMMFRIASLLVCLSCVAGYAQTVVPTQTIRPGTILTPELLRQTNNPAQPGVAQIPEVLIGLQANTALYLNRPVLLSHVSEPKVIQRNDIVTLIYESGTLQITGEGRALDPGRQNQRIRVMNLSSRQTVTGEVINKTTVRVF